MAKLIKAELSICPKERCSLHPRSTFVGQWSFGQVSFGRMARDRKQRKTDTWRKKIARKTSLTKGVFVALLYLDRFVAIDLLRKSFYLWQNKSLALKSFLLACLPQLKNICLFKGPERRRKNGKGKKVVEISETIIDFRWM